MSLAKKSWKRVIALFLAVVMAIAFAPNVAALADNTANYSMDCSVSATTAATYGKKATVLEYVRSQLKERFGLSQENADYIYDKLNLSIVDNGS